MAARVTAQPELIAAGIARVSLITQVDNYSLDAQVHNFAHMGEKFGCKIPAEYIIEDDGYSGADFNRPSIKQALKWVREGNVQAVAFPHLDRFARNVEGGLTLIRKFREAGAAVLLGNLGWYTDDRSFRMQMNIGLMFAEFQKDEIQEKSRTGVEQKIRQGLAHGGGSPFGWRFVTGAELTVQAMNEGREKPRRPQNVHKRVEKDIQIVALMGELALEGHGLRGICRELQARGIAAPRKIRWNPTTVGKILHDACYYTGIWHYNKRQCVEPKKIRSTRERHRVRTSWKARPQSDWKPQPLEGGPVFTKAKFDAIQEALARNGKTSVGRPAGENGREALLRSLVKCACCNKAVCPQHKTTPAGRRSWYSCSNRDRVAGNHLCPAARAIKADVLEEAVWNGMVEALTENLDALVEEHRSRLTQDVDSTELERMQALEPKLIGKMKEAAEKELAEDDADLKQMYSERVAELKGQLKLLRRRIGAFTMEADTIQVDTRTISREVKAGTRTRVPAERRQILVTWVQEVR